MRFSRQESWSGLPCPPPRDLPDPGIEPTSLTSPILAGRFFFTTSATWEAHLCVQFIVNSPQIFLMFSYYRMFSNVTGNPSLKSICKTKNSEKTAYVYTESENVGHSSISHSLQSHGLGFQVPRTMGFSRSEYWSALLFPSPGDLPDPGVKLRSPALEADSLPSEPPGKICL